MSVTFLLPGQLHELAGGQRRVVLDGHAGTVREAFANLRDRLPALYDRVLTEQGEVRPHVNVFVGRDNIRWSGGLDTPLEPDPELLILPSVSGG